MTDPLEPVGALSALGDPTRRRAYEHVCAHGRPVGRDEVATALGIGRTLAAYHLDRLAKDGLLSVAYARRSGRPAPAPDGPPSSRR
jgi:predicted ArsR family transcriptional regulator